MTQQLPPLERTLLYDRVQVTSSSLRQAHARLGTSLVLLEQVAAARVKTCRQALLTVREMGRLAASLQASLLPLTTSSRRPRRERLGPSTSWCQGVRRHELRHASLLEEKGQSAHHAWRIAADPDTWRSLPDDAVSLIAGAAVESSKPSTLSCRVGQWSLPLPAGPLSRCPLRRSCGDPGGNGDADA